MVIFWLEAHLESNDTRCLSISTSDCPIVCALAFEVFHFARKLFFGGGMLLKIADVLFESSAKISFNIILLILAVRIIAIFLLIDLFVFSSWWWMFDRYISIIDRKMSNTNECLINRFTSIVWKNSIVRQISIIKIEMVAPQRACRPLRDDVIK